MSAIKKPSPQAAAKEAQGFVQKLAPSTCANCKNFTSERILAPWMIRKNKEDKDAGQRRAYYELSIHGKEGNIRCGIGGFAVGKSSTCNLFERKTGGAA